MSQIFEIMCIIYISLLKEYLTLYLNQWLISRDIHLYIHAVPEARAVEQGAEGCVW